MPTGATPIPYPDLSRNALEVAPDLLNCALCRAASDGSITKLVINEVEAYHGFDDKASHAHRGKTKRNGVMFGDAGYWYVYLCYGVHWLLNLVTAEADYPSAVLVRGVSGYDGPGKLTKALGIDKQLDRQPCSQSSGLWIEPLPANQWVPKSSILRTGRIGVGYAGEYWSSVPWRLMRADCT